MPKQDEGRLSKGVVDKVADFLFGKAKGESASQFLDRRTDVSGKEMFKALTYYRILQERFKCETAGSVADILERLSISKDRMGRVEGVNVLLQKFPKEETVLKGFSELLERAKGESDSE